MTLLPQGFSTRAVKSTDGQAVVLVEGRIRAKVGDAELEFGPRDAAALPGWTEFAFEALEESVLFGFCDRPAHEALGLWREWREGAG